MKNRKIIILLVLIIFTVSGCSGQAKNSSAEVKSESNVFEITATDPKGVFLEALNNSSKQKYFKFDHTDGKDGTYSFMGDFETYVSIESDARYYVMFNKMFEGRFDIIKATDDKSFQLGGSSSDLSYEAMDINDVRKSDEYKSYDLDELTNITYFFDSAINNENLLNILSFEMETNGDTYILNIEPLDAEQYFSEAGFAGNGIQFKVEISQGLISRLNVKYSTELGLESSDLIFTYYDYSKIDETLIDEIMGKNIEKENEYEAGDVIETKGLIN